MRALRSLGLVALPVTVAACGFLLDFSEFRSALATNDGAVDPSSSNAEAGVGAFELIAPAEVLVEPGGAATFDVTIRRDPGFDGAVIVAADAPPPGITLAESRVTIERGATTATLQLRHTEGTSTPVGSKLELSATSGSGARSASVALRVRGRPCTLDRSFGGAGVVELPANATAPGELFPDAIAIQGSGMSVLAHDEGGVVTLYRVELDGSARIELTFQQAIRAIADDANGAFIRALDSTSGTIVRRHVDGGVDNTFGGTGQTVLPLSVAYPQSRALFARPSVAVAGRASPAAAAWRLAVLGPDGKLATAFGDGGVAQAAISGTDTRVNALAAVDDGFVACGTIGSGPAVRGIFERWSTIGASDAAFRANAPSLEGQDVTDCAPRLGGLVVAHNLVAGGGNGLLTALHADGTKDTSFGNGGLVAYAPPSRAVRILVDDQNRVVTLAQHFYRFGADGAPDTSIGDGGRCDLAQFGLKYPGDAAAQDADRVVVIASGQQRVVAARLWL